MTLDDIDPAPAPASTAGSEEYVLACCFQDRALIRRLDPEHFSTHRALAHALRYADSQKIPPTLDALVPALTKQQLQDIGGLPTLLQLTDPLRFSTTTDFEYHLRALATQHANQQARDLARRILESDNPSALLPEPPRAPPTPGRRPSEFSIPTPRDPSILLGNRYLNRGDALILSGSSGIGKSSISLQAVAEWATGQPFFGIKPNGALRSLIIQSEDSDGDVAEVWHSILHARKFDAAQLKALDANIQIVTDRVNRGNDFLHALRRHVDAFKPDLVWLNPLQAFSDCDITESKDLGRFLRGGLNGLNPNLFGYVIVHHTTKPATGKDRAERLWHEVMYDMAGGAELINWARGIISLRPEATVGDFTLHLAKRGRRAGVVTQSEDGFGTLVPVTAIPVRHATGSYQHNGGIYPLIFWEPRTPTPAAEPSTAKGGRPSKYSWSQYRDVFPPHSSPGLDLSKLERALLVNGKIERKSLHDVCCRWRDEGVVEIIEGIEGQPRRYRKTAQ